MENTARPILEPIVLNPVKIEPQLQTKKNPGRFRNLRLMAAGWILGNLIFGSILGLALIYYIASTGLVNVPLLTKALFKTPTQVTINSSDLASAKKKIEQVNKLASGQSIPTMSLTDGEISAFLEDSFQHSEAGIMNPKVSLEGDRFVLTGVLRNTGAPIKVEGNVNTSTGVFKLDIRKTIFGQRDLPPQVTNGIINAAFAKVGLSLDSTPIPARVVNLDNGKVTLEGVTKPSE